MKETMKDKIAKLDPSLINELSIIAQRRCATHNEPKPLKTNTIVEQLNLCLGSQNS